VLNSDLNTSVACGSSCIVLDFFSELLDLDVLLVEAACVDDFAAVSLSVLLLPSAQQNTILCNK